MGYLLKCIKHDEVRKVFIFKKNKNYLFLTFKIYIIYDDFFSNLIHENASLLFFYKMEDITPGSPILTHKRPWETAKLLSKNMQIFNASSEPQIVMLAKMTSRTFE